MRQIYFDNAATTPVDPAVVAAMDDIQTNCYGNPSSIHSPGQNSKVRLEQARAQIAAYIGAQPQEIIFTSGGTESDNLAIIGAAMANHDKGRKIVSTKIEHPAVLQCLQYLSQNGFKIDYLDLDKKGHFNLKQVENLVDNDTVLVSIMQANNETGHILDLSPVVDIVKQRNILFHTDAVQTLGKLKIDVGDLGVDLLSLSAHKIYGPKGCGALFARSGVQIDSQMLGGSQESNRRAGTENLATAVGFAAAVKELENQKNETEKIKNLRDLFENLLIKNIPGLKINGNQAERIFSHSNVYFPDFSGDSMLMNLDMNGIAVSTGSACSSGSIRPSHVLGALGYEKERVKNSVRFSFGRFNTIEEVKQTVRTILEIYKRTGNG
jgi:cysteine desulfurase